MHRNYDRLRAAALVCCLLHSIKKEIEPVKLLFVEEGRASIK